jgi:hypothetical protein
MDFLNERLNVPRRLSARLWLITLPSAIVSFEKRSDVPKLPATGSKALGAILLVGAVATGFLASRQPGVPLAYEGPMEEVVARPARLAGLVGLAGVSFVTRSTLLLAYTAGLAAMAGAGRMEIEEPSASTLLGGGS